VACPTTRPDEEITVRLRVVHKLAAIPAGRWDALIGVDNPFLRHAFLVALEETGAVSPAHGWHPCHLLLEDDEGRLLAAAPAYLKDNSHGEFVFDWAWAAAYRRAGRAYYPKLVMAVPFSPVTGPRVLHHPELDEAVACRHLIASARQLCDREGWSSAHCLFPHPAQQTLLNDGHWLARRGVQFHWANQGYADLDAFLDALASKKRKNIRRERRQAEDSGLQVELRPASAVSESDWATLQRCYQQTFDRYGNLAVLSLDFFLGIAEALPESVLMGQARSQSGELLGTALFLRSTETLYGRYWGCLEDRPGMHFETCYYQGIDYCIREGLQRFEPGAQGEHKLARGFLPSITHSLHWVSDPRFRAGVARFLEQESAMIDDYQRTLLSHSPFRSPV
jgi:uncharacterized protein